MTLNFAKGESEAKTSSIYFVGGWPGTTPTLLTLVVAPGYPMPNDEEEADRMDCFHEMMMVLHERRLHLAPIGDSPQRILDLGTGTGIWAIDMGMT